MDEHGRQVIKQAESDIKDGAVKVEIGGNVSEKTHIASWLKDHHPKVGIEINREGLDVASDFLDDTNVHKRVKKNPRPSSRAFFDMGRRR